MGHEIMHLTFDSSKSKRSIVDYCDQIVEEDGDGGSLGGIRFIDHLLFDSYEEAEEYIRKNDSGWYDNIGVRYRIPKKTKHLQGLEEKKSKAENKYYSVSSDIKYKIILQDTVRCRHCKTNIPGRKLFTTTCPHCKGDLRTNAEIERIKKLKEKAKLYAEQYKEEYERLKFVSDEFEWLVKIEYHI